jgi:hypothetical protein
VEEGQERPATTDASRGRFVTVAGRPSGARLTACTLLTVAIAPVLLTVVFVGVAIRDDGLGLEIVGVAAVFLILYGPLTLWAGGWWSLAVIAAVSLLTAMLTHRYRVVKISAARHRIGRTLFALLMIYSGWVLILAMSSLVYAVGGGPT